MRNLLLTIAATFICFVSTGQTKSVEVAKVNSGNWRVVEFNDISTGELSSVTFYLRDSRYSKLTKFFHFSFGDRDEFVDFLHELSKIYNLNEAGIHSRVHDYNVTTGKIMGGIFINISDDKTDGYSSLSKPIFTNLCKALRKKGYEIDFID